MRVPIAVLTVFALPCLVVCPSHAQTTDAASLPIVPHLTGEQMMMRSRAVYARLRSYQGDIQSQRTAVDKNGNTVDRVKTRAHVEFARPPKIHVSGTLDRKGMTFEYVSDGKAAWQRWTAKPEWKRIQSISYAALLSAPSSCNAGFTLPDILLNGAFYMNGTQGVEPGVRLETVNHRSLYRVEQRDGASLCTYWFNPKTMFLVQVRQRINPKMVTDPTPPAYLAGRLKERIAKMRDRNSRLSKRIEEMKVVDIVTLQVFSNIRVNRLISAGAFRLPKQSSTVSKRKG